MDHLPVDSDLFLFRSERGRLGLIDFRGLEFARAELVLAFLELVGGASRKFGCQLLDFMKPSRGSSDAKERGNSRREPTWRLRSGSRC